MKNSYAQEIQRKLIHISSLWMVFAIWVLEIKESIVIFGIFGLLIFVAELSRKYFSGFGNLYNKLFGNILRHHEINGKFSGAFFVLLAALISVVLFPKIIAMTSLSVMLISDSAAALIGLKFGRHKLFGKSIEGSLAFFISAILVISVFYNLGDYFIAIFVTAFLATITELFAKQINIDDNLTITLIVAICLFVLT